LIIDAQSVKNTKPVALKDYDVGKKKGSSVGANALQLEVFWNKKSTHARGF